MLSRVESDLKLDFSDVLIRPRRTTLRSRADVELECEYQFRHAKHSYKGIPIMAANMDSIGTLPMARELSKYGLFTCLCKHCSLDEWNAFADEYRSRENGDRTSIWNHVGAVSAPHDDDFARTKRIVDEIPDIKFIFLDVANGYMEWFVDFVRKAREVWPDHILVAGNVATPELTEELILTGADVVKIGIGPGSVCTTRKIAGVGYPQLSAVLECGAMAHELGAHIISDGGCTSPGDVAKAFGAGADFVMLGGMLAGHDQTVGPIIEKNGRKYKLFYGIASQTSMEKYGAAAGTHRAIEGRTIEIPYRGDISQTVQNILGGVRSACSYTGATKLQALRDVTRFIRVSTQVNETFKQFDTSE